MAGKKAKSTPESKSVLETSKPDPEPPIVAPKPEVRADLPKIAAVILLAVFVLAMAWYFFNSSAITFVPGPGVDAATFKDIFSNASRVHIVMDTRGVNDVNTSTNILQCGVDFAGSSGMGGKNVTHMALSNDSCVADDGDHTAEYCISELKNGVVINVKVGPGVADYYTNGMVVTVGSNYTVGTCGIRKV
jgi:hypothetical protein